MRLRRLEQLLRLPLLERSTAGTSLTPAGEATVEWATAVLHDMQALLVGTNALRAHRGSRLRLAASMTVAEYLMPRWLQQLGDDEHAPKVSLRMGNTAHVTELVTHGAADVGFIEGPRPPGRLRSRELLTDELAIVVAKGHPWTRRRQPISMRQLASTPLVLREHGSGTRDVLAERLGAHGLELTAAMELGSTTAIKAAVLAGTGVAVLSTLAVRGELDSGQLVAVPCASLSLRRAIRAIWSQSPSAAAMHLMGVAAADGAALART